MDGLTVRIDSLTLLLLVVLVLAVFFYVLFVVVRAAVRGALHDYLAAQAAPGGSAGPDGRR